MNYVPRDGGNTLRGLLDITFANNYMQGQDYRAVPATRAAIAHRSRACSAAA